MLSCAGLRNWTSRQKVLKKLNPFWNVGWKKPKKGKHSWSVQSITHSDFHVQIHSFPLSNKNSHWNRYKSSGQSHLTDFIGVEPSKKRKRRTSFTPQALELLNAHFERNTHPSGKYMAEIGAFESFFIQIISFIHRAFAGTEITGLAHQLGYEREVIRIWFCNKRQALKNTVRMMSKGMV